MFKGTGGVPVGRSPSVVPACRVYNSANISTLNTTNTTLTFDSERFDTDNIHNLAFNTSRLTCRTPGIYSIKGQVRFTANATGRRELLIFLNGTITLAAIDVVAGVTGTDWLDQVSTLYALGIGDYVELVAWQSSGGNLNVVAASNYSPEFMMHRIG